MWAVVGRSVVGEDWWFGVSVGEVVAEEEVGAGFCVGEFDGFGDFEVRGDWGVCEGLGGEVGSEEGGFGEGG